MRGLSAGGRPVAEYVVRPELALDLSPRPYLHPVRTLAQVTVTDAVPRDHPWHLGVGVALQHVQIGDGRTVNFWGGRTFVPDQGYTWLDDHGRIEHVGWTGADPAAIEEELRWVVPGGPEVLRERRTMAASADPVLPAWWLRLAFTLENVTQAPVSLGSPGSRGRSGGGYGGFFWRTAPAEQIRISTPEHTGEEAVHGRPAEWLIFGGTDPGTDQAWTLLLAGQDDATRGDPWFVRAKDYPGVGSALAYERPVVLDPGTSVHRSLLVGVVDGILTSEQASAALVAARGE